MTWWYTAGSVACGSEPGFNDLYGRYDCLANVPLGGTEPGPSSCNGTNPIHSATGNKFQRELVAAGNPSFFPAFEWFYNSKPYGTRDQWTHSFNRSVENSLGFHLNPPSGFVAESTLNAWVQRPDGRSYLFTNHYDGTNRTTETEEWTSQSTAILGRLETRSDVVTGEAIGLRYIDPDGTREDYDLDGRLLSFVNPQGFSYTTTYDADRLTEVTGSFGHRYLLSYNGASLLEKLEAPGDIQYRFEYTPSGLLEKIVFPDDTPLDDTDNPHRMYHYDYPHQHYEFELLVGITNESGNRSATWAYDPDYYGFGRAIASHHAQVDTDAQGNPVYADHYTLEYFADGTHVTDPLGKERVYKLAPKARIHRLESLDTDCVGCGGGASSYTYDANGFVSSQTDFNGNVTTYTRDDLGRERSRTEAVGTPDARTVTTTWHTELNKPLTVTEPGRVVSYRYDPDGRLLAKTEQPQP